MSECLVRLGLDTKSVFLIEYGTRHENHTSHGTSYKNNIKGCDAAEKG